MFKSFVLTQNPLFVSLFCLSIVFNVHILATNESQRTELNEVLNSSDITVDNIDNTDNTDTNHMNDNTIDSSIESTNETELNSNKLLSISADMDEVNESIQLSSGSNGSDSHTNSSTESVSKLNQTIESKVNCTSVNTYSSDNQSIETISELILVNATTLTEYLESKPNVSQTTGAQCCLVIFYYKWCPFTAKYAKHFNALARVYPQFHVLAIDAYGLNSVNMRYGLVGIPSVLFFHNGKAVGKVNDSEPTVDAFVTYISQLTGLAPVMSTNITEADLLGPLSSTPEPRFDYLLLFSWIFCILCFSYLIAKSKIFKTTIETIRNAWREAEAQHEHID